MPNFTTRHTNALALASAALLAAFLVPAGTAVAAGPTPVTAGAAATAATAARTVTVPVRTETLVDGSTARIYELGFKHYKLEIVYRGYVVATIEANQHDAGVDANDMFVVLTFDGTVTSWIGGSVLGPGSFPLPDGSTAVITRATQDHATLNIVHRGSVTATLDANQHDDAVNANGMYVVLTFDGQFSAWISTP